MFEFVFFFVNFKSDANSEIVYFLTKYAALTRKSKDWLARNQDNVSEWSEMFIHELIVRNTNNNHNFPLILNFTKICFLTLSWVDHTYAGPYGPGQWLHVSPL